MSSSTVDVFANAPVTRLLRDLHGVADKNISHGRNMFGDLYEQEDEEGNKYITCYDGRESYMNDSGFHYVFKRSSKSDENGFREAHLVKDIFYNKLVKTEEIERYRDLQAIIAFDKDYAIPELIKNTEALAKRFVGRSYKHVYDELVGGISRFVPMGGETGEDILEHESATYSLVFTFPPVGTTMNDTIKSIELRIKALNKKFTA